MTTTQQVRFNLNVEKFAPKAGKLFTNCDTFIKEALQNSRRAGATLIEIEYDPQNNELFIIDNGRGIKDFSVLLQGCESDWDQQTIDNESPFGLGFISLIDAAEQVEVFSLNKYATFTENVLCLEPVTVETTEDHFPGTAIRLTGMKHSFYNNVFEDLAVGFPVAITLNGSALKQPFQEEENPDIQLDCGSLDFSRANIGDDSQYLVFYQGFLILHKGYRPACDNLKNVRAAVIHLNETVKDAVRMPDRDSLKDGMAKKVTSEIKQAIEQHTLTKVTNALESLGDEKFVETWGDICASKTYLTSLLNDCNFLPCSFFYQADNTISATDNSNYQDYLTHFTGQTLKVMSKEAIASTKVYKHDLSASTWDDEECELNFALQAYLIEHNALYLNKNLHTDHWIHSMITSEEQLRNTFSWKIVDAVDPSCEEDALERCTPKLCQSLRLDGCWGEVVVHDKAVRIEDTLYIPHNEFSGDGVLQDSCFFDEFDTFLESQLEDASSKLSNWITNERLKHDPAALLQEFLKQNNINGITKSLAGKSLTINVEEDLTVSVKAA